MNSIRSQMIKIGRKNKDVIAIQKIKKLFFGSSVEVASLNITNYKFFFLNLSINKN